MQLTTSTWWGFSICKTAHTRGSGYHPRPFRRRRALICFHGKTVIILLSVLFLRFSHSLIKFALWNRGRLRRLKLFCEQEAREMGRICLWVAGGALRVPAQFHNDCPLFWSPHELGHSTLSSVLGISHPRERQWSGVARSPGGIT